ncbi:MAG: hypothetical protein KF902_06125 [Phycisphaeraceae bacterium]|nr:hypothetical protein [Phycisphaeraceae bacterium]QYK48969.1 MAG: hypothetical protein KF838_03750 [Phycisphaeraceae bacterium]
MKAILIRVGADSTDGGGNWRAPVDPETLEYVYVPIPEYTSTFLYGCDRRFDEALDPLSRFLDSRGSLTARWQKRIAAKRGQIMHLDPDFEHLTYGDIGDARGRDLKHLSPGDLLVFYASLRSIRQADHLVYAMIGQFVVDEVLFAPAVESSRRYENAHTRKDPVFPRDIVVRARVGCSGRCLRCVPIGERRDGGNYYLTPEIESAWGGLVKSDGSPRRSSWLNMSGAPPLIGNAEAFSSWWARQDVALVRSNFGS